MLPRAAVVGGPRNLSPPQAAQLIEGEDGHVDLRHHGSQERGGLERFHSLRTERVAERVHLEEDETERVVAARAAAPDGEVPFAQRGQHVRHRL